MVPSFARWIAAVVFLCLFSPEALYARQWSGNVSVTFDSLPNRSDTYELRSRFFLETTFEPTLNLRITLSGFAEGLFAERESIEPPDVVTRTRITDVITRPQDINMELTIGNLDLLVGYARVVWGRLDELQPTDVINPLDVSRFFFEGRGEARLPVGLVRARLSLGEHATIDGVYVPVFQRGRFDLLDEATSPFNPLPAFGGGDVACLAIGCPVPVRTERLKPEFASENWQGGGRLSVTVGRVDWSLSAYRGFEPFGVLVATPEPDGAILISETYPRFTMFGADFETVFGEWGLRGEIAVFPEDNFQSPLLQRVEGRSIEGGIGFDRSAGSYTFSGTLLVHSETYDAPLEPGAIETSRSDVSVIGSAERSFAQERYRLRGFAVYNTTEESGFLRGIAIVKLSDNVALEGSGGWFVREGRDAIGRFSNNDFVYGRLKFYF